MQLNSQANNEENVIITEEHLVKVSIPFEKGVTSECCAGIVDYQKPLIEIAKNEVLEETGYDVPIENIERIFDYAGINSGSKVVFYYVEVTDDMKTSKVEDFR